MNFVCLLTLALESGVGCVAVQGEFWLETGVDKLRGVEKALEVSEISSAHHLTTAFACRECLGRMCREAGAGPYFPSEGGVKVGSCAMHGDEGDDGGQGDGGVWPVKTAGSTVTRRVIADSEENISSRDPAEDQLL
ncbi:hypothetical protein EV421DRAFT_1743101 [Armillaria borealis]|uniref:Secreted protein n=1 Tax=Armillaria borealis TaxID=47425 RepID=A0AA39IW09_9AGAR|nr:hypothetical protein EV421DRAFT_1743101 [Armillaria borealis]